MELTIDIPEKVIRHAEAMGKPVLELVSEAIDSIADGPAATEPLNQWERMRGSPTPGFQWLGKPTMSPEEAVNRIRRLAAQTTLGDDLTIKQLIEEERRY